jgi:two-component system chemotaxis response regulator CheB
MVLVCPGGRHAFVTAERTLGLEPGRSPAPSADRLLHSVAATFQEGALAVVLTGTGRDGADGARAIRRSGGFVIAQESSTAEFPDMPESAIETRAVDLVLPLRHIPLALELLAKN